MLRLLQGLKPGGVLAVQMPDNLDEPSHVWMREVRARSRYAKSCCRKIRASARCCPRSGEYYDALKPHCSQLEIWHTFISTRWTARRRSSNG